MVQVKIWGHDYGNVKGTEAYGDRFKGDYWTPDSAPHHGFFGWSEVKGSGAKPKPAAPEAEPTKPGPTKPPEPNPSTEKPEPSPALKPGDVHARAACRFPLPSSRLRPPASQPRGSTHSPRQRQMRKECPSARRGSPSCAGAVLRLAGSVPSGCLFLFPFHSGNPCAHLRPTHPSTGATSVPW